MRQSIITRMNECWFEFSRQIWWPNLVANQAVNSTKFWICFLTISNSFVIKVFYAMYLSNIRSLTCFSLFIGSMKHLKLFCLGIILHVASDFFFSWEIKWSGIRWEISIQIWCKAYFTVYFLQFYICNAKLFLPNYKILALAWCWMFFSFSIGFHVKNGSLRFHFKYKHSHWSIISSSFQKFLLFSRLHLITYLKNLFYPTFVLFIFEVWNRINSKICATATATAQFFIVYKIHATVLRLAS